MPQYMTVSVGAKVDKGPELKSDVKLEVGPYGAAIEEQVCKCATSPTFNLRIEDPDHVDSLVITADRYSNDKDSCGTGAKPTAFECKHIKYWFVPATPEDKGKPPMPGFSREHPFELDRPHVLIRPFLKQVVPQGITGIVFQNDLTTDVKVSALIVQKPACACPQK